jgi:hypothetical protein
MVAIFSFPDGARWSEVEQAVQFTLIGARPTPDQCVQHYHLNRAGIERIAEANIRGHQLDDDANIRISGRDLRDLKARP